MDVGVGSGDADATTPRAVRRVTSLQRRGPGLSDTLRVDAALLEVDEQSNDGMNDQSAQKDDSDTDHGIQDDDDERDSPGSADGRDEEDGEAGRHSVSDVSEKDEEVRSDVGLVAVEPPQVWHSSWEAWQAYFTLYCQRTMQVLPVKETMSRAERNKRLKRTKKGEDDSQMVPETMDPYQRTYICTHGWKKRKSRSEGSRPRQHIRLTNCPFRFIVQWNLARGELQVKNGSYLHNHTVSASAYATYPTSRGIADPLVGAHVDGMLAVGAKRSRIYDYLLDHDENVIQSDVDNLVRSHSSSISTLDDNDATAREIALFAAADPENVSSVAETDAGESGVISIATAHMRRVFGRFSELLLVDCSHKTNRYNYQLLTFMAMNEFGEGAVVQQSLIEANGDWHMERAISHFKRSHPTRLQSLRVIIVDKDLNEIRVLEANFPDARVLICHFHVIKYLKEMRAKPEFGKLSAEDASQIDGAVHKMVYALSEDKYSEAHDSLKGICERCGMDAFFAYFEKNWDASRERWVLYLRSTLPHFKNHTNNRLESFFGKLKESVDGSLSMAQCVKSLIAFDRRKEKEYQYRVSRIGQFVNSNYDEEMSNVLRFTTHYVAGQIEHKYTSAMDKASKYQYEMDKDDAFVVIVRGLFSEHKLSLDSWICDCEFATSMSLPCRHAIAYRKKHAVTGTLIPWIRIDERWTTSSRQLKKVKQFTYERFSRETKGASPQLIRTRSDRYREAVRATHLIANELADIENNDEFDEMLRFVINQWRNVRQRKMADTEIDAEVMEGNDDDVKREFGISSSDDEDMESDTNVSRGETCGVTIKLNPKAKKVGAPRKLKKKIQAGEQTDRKWYEAAEAGRKKAGEVSLVALCNALDREQPGLTEMERRLSGVLVKYGDFEKKKPKLKVMKNPVLVQDPFYVLPAKLLDACAKLLPVGNTPDDAISIDDSQQSQSQGVSGTAAQGTVETLIIKDVGNFSRKQIETFKRIQNLKAQVQLGLDMHKWILQDALPALPAEHHDIATKAAADVLAAYPHKSIKTLPNYPDFQYAMLYRATPPVWLNDATIRALCLRLCEDYPTCRFAGFQSATTRSKRTRNPDEQVVDAAVRDQVIQQASEQDVETVLLPLNFMNFHWCCVTVMVSQKRIFYYDPLNQGPYMNAAKAVATHLKLAGLRGYDVIPQNNPVQFDPFSCGVYVCWMFIRQVCKGVHPDMSKTALNRRRFELFYYLLTGRLLAVEASRVTPDADDDGTEEKLPPPSSDGKINDDEEVPPTQLAQ